MGYSVKIFLNKHYVRKDGTLAIYLQVIVDRKKKIIPLDIFWPAARINHQRGVLLPRHKNDDECEDFNVILHDAIGKANDIFRHYRLAGLPVTFDRFMRDWNSGSSKISFTQFVVTAARQRLKDGEITYTTYQNHLKTIVKLQAWKKDILFCDLDERWAYEFDGWLQRTIQSRGDSSQNTRWAIHKNVKTYLHYAERVHAIKFDDPYQFFSLGLVDSTWRSLTQDEFDRIWMHYHTMRAGTERRVLRRFLFAVATGLRVSDLYRVTDEWVDGDFMRFIPQKTKRKNKVLEIPMSRMARELFDEALSEKGSGKLFDDLAEQKSNELLKVIAKRLGINKNIHHHVARSTFITLYLENGGKIDMAKELAGHADIKTTMGYNHISDSRKVSEIGYIDKIVKR